MLHAPRSPRRRCGLGDFWCSTDGVGLQVPSLEPDHAQLLQVTRQASAAPQASATSTVGRIDKTLDKLPESVAGWTGRVTSTTERVVNMTYTKGSVAVGVSAIDDSSGAVATNQRSQSEGFKDYQGVQCGVRTMSGTSAKTCYVVLNEGVITATTVGSIDEMAVLVNALVATLD